MLSTNQGDVSCLKRNGSAFSERRGSGMRVAAPSGLRGLKGEQIPLAARLFAIVDVWDALRSDRPYRAAWSEERTREHVRSLSGSHFDPAVVAAFLDGGLAAVWDGRLYQPSAAQQPAVEDVLGRA
jgi:hypothetical protein